MYKRLRHRYHAVDTLRVYRHLLLGLSYIQLRGTQQTSGYKLELKLLILLVLDRHKFFDNLHIYSRKPYHYRQVYEIEHSVKHRHTERHTELHGGYTGEHGMFAGQTPVKQAVVKLRISGFQIIDKSKQ